MREISLFVTFLCFFFRFFTSPTDRHGWPIFTIYTSGLVFRRSYYCTQYDRLLAWYCRLSICSSLCDEVYCG